MPACPGSQTSVTPRARAWRLSGKAERSGSGRGRRGPISQVVGYIHPGNRLATLVAFTAPLSAEAGRDVAMQAAAMAPIALDESSVAPELIAKEKEIGMDLAMQEGKPADMAEKIADGRIKKWFKEVTLVHQQFIKDNKLTVAEYVKSANASATISGFCRSALD